MSECVLFCGDAVIWRELLPVALGLGGALLAGYLTADEDWYLSLVFGFVGAFLGALLGLVVAYAVHDPKNIAGLAGILVIGLIITLGRWLRLVVYAVKRRIDEAAWRATYEAQDE